MRNKPTHCTVLQRDRLANSFFACLIQFSLVMGIIAPGAGQTVHAAEQTARAYAQGGAVDWPKLSFDEQMAGTTSETILHVATIARLQPLGYVLTGGVISASPTVVNGIISVGSWDGKQYWFDWNGSPVGTTDLGVNHQPQCVPSEVGIASTGTRKNGLMYVGGNNNDDGSSNAYFSVIDETSHQVVGKVSLGNLNTGSFNWSSPLVDDQQHYAYVGLASFGDCPLPPGGVAKIDISDSYNPRIVTITATVDVSAGETGGGIWTTPSLSPDGKTVYVSTGSATQPNNAQPLAEAIVALDAATLQPKWHWRIDDPQDQDRDWGTNVLVGDVNGEEIVTAVNKNGYLYAFDAATGTRLFSQQIAIGGKMPQNGAAPISSGVSVPENGGEVIYAAGTAPATDRQCPNAPGTVRALNPVTGRLIWEHCAPGMIIAALAAGDGFVVDGAGSTMEVLNTKDGSVLYQYTFSSQGQKTYPYSFPEVKNSSSTNLAIYAAPSISGGRILIGLTNGQLYAFGLPGLSRFGITV